MALSESVEIASSNTQAAKKSVVNDPPATIVRPINYRLILKLAGVPLFGAYISSYAMWQDKAGNLVTGLGLGGWGDLLFHIRAAVFFGEQGGWPHESFFLSGNPVGYAFVSDFISALLWKMGLPIAQSFSLPTVVLVTSLLLAWELVAWRLTKSINAAIVSAILFICFGGLSGWRVLGELTPDSWTKLRDLPHGITVWREADYAVLNPFVMMMHQRAFLLGFPLFVGLIYVSWKFLMEKSPLMLALLVGAATLLALFHPFTWVSFLMIFASWMAWMILLNVRSYTTREIGMTLCALGLISLLGFLIVKTLQPNAGASSFTWHPGWLATETNWIFFWLKNIGAYSVLAGITIYYFRQRNAPLAVLMLAALTPFVAANLIQFAPWDWDNTKIFAPVWIVLAIGVGNLLVSLWERNQIHWRLLCVGLFPLLILSGGLEVARIMSYRFHPFTISTAQELSMGTTIRSRLDKQQVMLSEPEASHPIFMYSGRPSFVAYEGWLWSQGWKGKYEQRLLDKKVIYGGNEAARDLIQKNNIGYVVIGPPELKAGANQQWFDQNYSRLLVLSDYTIYDVKSALHARNTIDQSLSAAPKPSEQLAEQNK
jgi:hypothetical protein